MIQLKTQLFLDEGHRIKNIEITKWIQIRFYNKFLNTNHIFDYALFQDTNRLKNSIDKDLQNFEIIARGSGIHCVHAN